MWVLIINITFGSDMPITLLHLMLMGKIYIVISDMNIEYKEIWATFRTKIKMFI